MVNPYRQVHLRFQVETQTNKRGPLLPILWRMVSLNLSNNNYHLKMVWCKTHKLTKTTGSNCTNNRTSKPVNRWIILRCLKTRTIIQKWEWVSKIAIRNVWLSMTRVSSSKLANHLRGIRLLAKDQVHIIMTKYSLWTCQIWMERMLGY